MNFGSLSSEHQIMVLLALKGGPEYAAQMEAATAETGLFGKALLRTSEQMNVATKRSWLHNQAMFTARRYAFYATLAVTGLAFEIGKLGMSYLSTVQTARVALRGLFPTQDAMDGIIHRLYIMSTLSPFLFKDTLTAFRTLYPAFHAVGIGTSLTLRIMQGAMNALSESGRASTGSLTRIGVQLQHLANIGRPTGQVLLALARDGLPVYPALRKELGLTGASLENLSTSGLTAKQVLQALADYTTKVMPFQGAASRLAMQTLQGNWQMFKDILAQAAGTAEGGLFGGLTNRLRAVNEYLAPMLRSNRPIGLYQIAQAIDHSLTPSTHIVLNLFIALDGAVNAFINTLGILATVAGIIMAIPTALANAFGFAGVNARILGGFIGMLAAAFVVAKIVLMPFIIAIDLWRAATIAAEAVSKGFLILQYLMDANWSAAWALITGNTVAITENTVANEANMMSLSERYDAMIAANTIMGVTTVETEAATVATFGFGAALDAMLGPIGLVLAGLSLLIYYHKQIAHFRPVAGLTSFVRHPIRGIHNIRHHPGHAGHTALDFLFPEVMLGRKLFHFQHGGTMPFGGPALVGEGGPELVHLPSGAQVTPIGTRGLVGAGSINIHVYPQDIYLDRKKIGTVIAEATTDKQARK